MILAQGICHEIHFKLYCSFVSLAWILAKIDILVCISSGFRYLSVSRHCDHGSLLVLHSEHSQHLLRWPAEAITWLAPHHCHCWTRHLPLQERRDKSPSCHQLATKQDWWSYWAQWKYARWKAGQRCVDPTATSLDTRNWRSEVLCGEHPAWPADDGVSVEGQQWWGWAEDDVEAGSSHPGQILPRHLCSYLDVNSRGDAHHLPSHL